MTAFYTWPQAILYLITLLIALCVLFQTLATVLSFYRHRSSYRMLFEEFLELFILIQIICCSLLHGQIIQTHDMLFIVSAGYGDLRIALFVILTISALIILLTTRKWWPLLISAAAGLTLPVIERLAGNIFAYLYLAMMLFWFIRSICVSVKLYKEITSSISALSVKNAIDSLRAGVMFCEENGFIILANVQMQWLMIATTGRVQRNGRRFQKLVTEGEIEPNCSMTRFEGHRVCLLPDNSAWMFTSNDLLIGSKKYTQITATDISERWKLTEKLQFQNAELIERQKELNEVLENIHILSRELETQKAKMRAHDILGTRLTLLLRALQRKQPMDDTLLKSLSQGFLEELRADRSLSSPQDEIDILKQEFGAIGVEVLFDGELPADLEKGKLFADISKEAVTNAVRHGFATKVNISVTAADGCSRIRVTDNGQLSSKEIKEGGGLGGMRIKLKPFHGTLTITMEPGFTLTVDLPEDENDDKSTDH